MLVLSRRINEALVINDNIKISVVSIQGNKVRLAISAPPDVRVDREEIHQRRVVWTEEIEVPVGV